MAGTVCSSEDGDDDVDDDDDGGAVVAVRTRVTQLPEAKSGREGRRGGGEGIRLKCESSIRDHKINSSSLIRQSTSFHDR